MTRGRPPALAVARGRLRVVGRVVRGWLGARQRRVDPERPLTWELRAFSQSGEDGIVAHLVGLLQSPGRTFLEVGAGYGIDGNTARLAVVERWRGLMVEADPDRAAWARAVLAPFTRGVEVLALHLEVEGAGSLAAALPSREPDVLSLDVDGIDYHLARALLAAGLRPRIVVVEYNSAFGPHEALTVPCRSGFDFREAHPSGLYYGASIAAWRRLLGAHGYRFVTVESRGVNAVFADAAAFTGRLPDRLAGLEFRENAFQLARFEVGWEGQLARIRDLPLERVG